MKFFVADITELDYTFVASLIANSFFSTFPRRTNKSHPTLQNFNFSNFFQSLQSPTQQAKLKSLFAYFDWLDTNDNLLGSVRVLRQVSQVVGLGRMALFTFTQWFVGDVEQRVAHDRRLVGMHLAALCTAD